MKKREKVFYVANTVLFTVDMTEKGQTILTCTVVSILDVRKCVRLGLALTLDKEVSLEKR
jgi:hypothetical protein